MSDRPPRRAPRTNSSRGSNKRGNTNRRNQTKQSNETKIVTEALNTESGGNTGIQISQLKEVFPLWSEDDLLFAIQDADGDIELAIARISEGFTPQWGEVKRKQKEKSKNKAIDSSISNTTPTTLGSTITGTNTTGTNSSSANSTKTNGFNSDKANTGKHRNERATRGGKVISERGRGRGGRTSKQTSNYADDKSSMNKDKASKSEHNGRNYWEASSTPQSWDDLNISGSKGGYILSDSTSNNDVMVGWGNDVKLQADARSASGWSDAATKASSVTGNIGTSETGISRSNGNINSGKKNFASWASILSAENQINSTQESAPNGTAEVVPLTNVNLRAIDDHPPPHSPSSFGAPRSDVATDGMNETQEIVTSSISRKHNPIVSIPSDTSKKPSNPPVPSTSRLVSDEKPIIQFGSLNLNDNENAELLNIYEAKNTSLKNTSGIGSASITKPQISASPIGETVQPVSRTNLVSQISSDPEKTPRQTSLELNHRQDGSHLDSQQQQSFKGQPQVRWEGQTEDGSRQNAFGTHVSQNPNSNYFENNSNYDAYYQNQNYDHVQSNNYYASDTQRGYYEGGTYPQSTYEDPNRADLNSQVRQSSQADSHDTTSGSVQHQNYPIQAYYNPYAYNVYPQMSYGGYSQSYEKQSMYNQPTQNYTGTNSYADPTYQQPNQLNYRTPVSNSGPNDYMRRYDQGSSNQNDLFSRPQQQTQRVPSSSDDSFRKSSSFSSTSGQAASQNVSTAHREPYSGYNGTQPQQKQQKQQQQQPTQYLMQPPQVQNYASYYENYQQYLPTQNSHSSRSGTRPQNQYMNNWN